MVTADKNLREMTNDGDADDQEMDEDGSFSSSYDEDEGFSDDDDSSLGSEMDAEAQSMWNALHDPQGQHGHQQGQQQQPPGPPPKTPEQRLQETLNAIQDSKTTAIKLDDGLVAFLLEENRNDGTSRLTDILKLSQDLLAAVQSCKEVRHVILGTTLLQLLLTASSANTGNLQTQLFQALVSCHASTITYWKLGSNADDGNGGPGGGGTTTSSTPTSTWTTTFCIPARTNLLEIMLNTTTTTSWPTLTECQVRGLEIQDASTIQDEMVRFLQRTAPTIKLFNWLGLTLSESCRSTSGLFDPLWTAIEPISQLDEVQLQVLQQPTTSPSSSSQAVMLPPLLSHSTLQHLLDVKPKWWRMALDGTGLDDTHLQILGQALQSSKDCKMNDLLSLRHNPKVTPKGLEQLYHVCLNKARMGLVHSDDPSWEATFDLVRPLNNLHRRLEFKNNNDIGESSGRFTSVERWMEWFQVLSNLPWIDETRKLNYIWFTVLEQPEMIAAAILACCNTTATSTAET